MVQWRAHIARDIDGGRQEKGGEGTGRERKIAGSI